MLNELFFPFFSIKTYTKKALILLGSTQPLVQQENEYCSLTEPNVSTSLNTTLLPNRRQNTLH